MSSESKEDGDKSRPPKNRGEVYAQEQQRIAEETKADKSKEPRPPKNRGEVYAQEQQRIVVDNK